MPHLTLEYSANLANEESIGDLCRKLAQSLDAQRENDQRLYPPGGIRVRALRCEQYCIADGKTEAAFLHANLKIGAGRSETAKKATGDALFEVIKLHFAQTFEKQGLALSLEINEFSEAGTWKHNNLHVRLKS
ncbi:5-carboxymethyl-2-hydroxymuconate Delta-isomerase [Paraburkholderia sabiae]|uniref:5-carboxymethyl-2-hydroxymuconate Delta-isomerase n=1 Tax=Paraburkholderia sabiae TaxID=273251 RepID=A0ABU9QLG2_9BURK|nr:5-carboxymethyl-2-hydroxymuconate Delta-isomerase [Paraburkholderia sabiae]WJZ76492.1 5-carboxymethyl-2-hydroxymuconate Delta-isomerase [Paraburkholderia sabiae]CAD6560226.1 5-carboxymethyl-2-hydroxymuconate Delta-isomerase [Paraburkholderia sabiae]